MLGTAVRSRILSLGYMLTKIRNAGQCHRLNASQFEWRENAIKNMCEAILDMKLKETAAARPRGGGRRFGPMTSLLDGPLRNDKVGFLCQPQIH